MSLHTKIDDLGTDCREGGILAKKLRVCAAATVYFWGL